jgi:hypothetical protein
MHAVLGIVSLPLCERLDAAAMIEAIMTLRNGSMFVRIEYEALCGAALCGFGRHMT